MRLLFAKNKKKIAAQVVAVCGPTGSGKTTLAKELEKKGFVRVSFGEIFRAHLKKKGMENPSREEMHKESRKLREETKGHKGSFGWLLKNSSEADWGNPEQKIVVEFRHPWEILSLIIFSKGKITAVYCDVSKKIRIERIKNRDKCTEEKALESVNDPGERPHRLFFSLLRDITSRDGDDPEKLAGRIVSLMSNVE